jgi:recombination protein RecA
MKGIPREAKEVLSDRQYKLVIGTLLGDGSLLRPHNWGKNCRLEVEHSAKQKDYVFWKFHELGDWVRTEPKFVCLHKSWRFRTKSHEVFTKLADDFYANHAKIVPDKMWRMITDPLVLAVWYMDDGGVRRYKGDVYNVYLNTQGFTETEVIKISGVLARDLKINPTPERNHGRWRLRVPRKDVAAFAKIVKPYILPLFRYKLPLAP